MKLYERIWVRMYGKTKVAFSEEVRKRSYSVSELVNKFVERFLENPERTLYFLFSERKRK